MTVKELIEQLQTLDQDRGIWIFYDYPCGAYEPDFTTRVSDEIDVLPPSFKRRGVNEDDYVMEVG